MTRGALVAAVVAVALGCGRSEPRGPVGTAGSSTPTGTNNGSNNGSNGANEPAPPSVIPASARTLVTAVVADWSSTAAELRLWSREGDRWRAEGPAWPAVIGRTGAAWGVGLHGDGAPTGHDGPRKHEGDGKSPAGVFALTATFGYASTPPAGATMPYTQVDDRWKCVDDPASRSYNRILDQRTVTVDWASAEDMRRSDELYTWVVEIGHNARARGGEGSCIFLHVWGGDDRATAGCTAMAEPVLAALLTRLAPGDTPTFVLLPRASYDALAATWRLPP